MKTCPNCNASNQDGFSFCEKCGTRLEAAQNKEPVNEASNMPATNDEAPAQPAPMNTTSAEPAPVNTAQDVPAAFNPSAVNPAPVNAAPASPAPSGTSAKKSSPAIKIVLGLAAVLVLYFVVTAIFGSNPTYKLLDGLAKLAAMEKSTMIMDVKIEYDGDTEEAEILNDVNFKTEVASDTKNLLAESSIELLYKNKSVAKVLAGINNEDLYVDLLNLYKDKKFYQEMDSMVPDYGDYVNDIKIVLNALRSSSLKIDKKKYADIIDDVLKRDIKRSGNKITVTLDSDTLVEIVEEVLSEAADDEKLMKSVRNYSVDVIKRILKDRKKLELIDEDDLEEALENLEDEKDFEDMYQDALDQALSNVSYSMGDLGDEEIELTFVFGMFNKIKSIEYKFNYEEDFSGESLDVSLKADIKSGAKFTKINKKDALKITKLVTDPDEMKEIAETVTKNLVKAVEKHDELVETIEELTGQDIDEAVESVFGEMYFGF